MSKTWVFIRWFLEVTGNTKIPPEPLTLLGYSKIGRPMTLHTCTVCGTEYWSWAKNPKPYCTTWACCRDYYIHGGIYHGSVKTQENIFKRLHSKILGGQDGFNE